jgi:hypothetical protein
MGNYWWLFIVGALSAPFVANFLTWAINRAHSKGRRV